MKPIAALLFGVLLSGCYQATMPSLDQLPDQPADYSDALAERLKADGWTVYRPGAQSLLIVEVRRKGSLGHSHVISTDALQGTIGLKDQLISGELFIAVADLQVDDPALRAAAGEEFQSELKEKDRTDTRANMLSEKVLNATANPFLRANATAQPLDGQIDIEFGAGGGFSSVEVRAIRQSHSSGTTLVGNFSLAQTDLGITPFTIFGGAVGIADELVVRFSITLTEDLN